MYVLDTNTLIYYFKGQGNVAQNLALVSEREVVIPSIVLFELYVGVAKSNSPTKRLQQLNTFSARVSLLPFNQSTAIVSAKIRAYLEKQGQTIGPLDVLIAGTALSCEAKLVTHNVREFSRVPNLEVIDWYE
ncbi:putative nucleic acid-binding protein [Leptolyngbya sp. PCC 7375]|nr:putative nucleic acid-binding protein [Leptolyngbya sp. PCC 7375]